MAPPEHIYTNIIQQERDRFNNSFGQAPSAKTPSEHIYTQNIVRT